MNRACPFCSSCFAWCIHSTLFYCTLLTVSVLQLAPLLLATNRSGCSGCRFRLLLFCLAIIALAHSFFAIRLHVLRFFLFNFNVHRCGAVAFFHLRLFVFLFLLYQRPAPIHIRSLYFLLLPAFLAFVLLSFHLGRDCRRRNIHLSWLFNNFCRLVLVSLHSHRLFYWLLRFLFRNGRTWHNGSSFTCSLYFLLSPIFLFFIHSLNLHLNWTVLFVFLSLFRRTFYFLLFLFLLLHFLFFLLSHLLLSHLFLLCLFFLYLLLGFFAPSTGLVSIVLVPTRR
mmetsp:Transcript_27063/g.69648  ORF Transcript_27063/g.69648 Transcript_27063/m.69648 type:complete len:281 (-) Transcript_27063:1601-2443(-)